MTTESLNIVDASGIDASATLTITDPLDAFNMLSNRLYCEGEVLKGMSTEYYNEYGHCFDSETLTQADIDYYRENYSRLQPIANRHGIALDMLVERQALTTSLVGALHSHYLATHPDRPTSSVGRAAEQHRLDDWNAAMKGYSDTTAEVEAAQGDEATNAAATVHHGQIELLMRTRSPNLDALREKVRIARAELGDTTYSVFTNLLADIDRLN